MNTPPSLCTQTESQPSRARQALSTFSKALAFSFVFFLVEYGMQHTQLVLVLEAKNMWK